MTPDHAQAPRYAAHERLISVDGDLSAPAARLTLTALARQGEQAWLAAVGLVIAVAPGQRG